MLYLENPGATLQDVAKQLEIPARVLVSKARAGRWDQKREDFWRFIHAEAASRAADALSGQVKVALSLAGRLKKLAETKLLQLEAQMATGEADITVRQALDMLELMQKLWTSTITIRALARAETITALDGFLHELRQRFPEAYAWAAQNLAGVEAGPPPLASGDTT